jgi:DNA polymerase-3 subunit gamma/tau
MPDENASAALGASSPCRPREYVVVARRYRPQSFEELVGQSQVSQALAAAIQTSRVGHAYLFTGARGVGKTSTARIFAKALNCVRGPTTQPCNECDSCLGIASGDDVDVLEIDGASNRGIDEIRQLRSNVNIRPSRARFKIYIIDEVHMLTGPAFNALLKTLEEPPEHVKFIFCTTDPEKIPITVLSRCQRFDFPPVETDAILARLRQIVDAEGVAAETEALQILARRAGGSMRDSQSLLEQLLSFSGEKITAEDVHKMLGTAKSGRLIKLTEHLANRDAAAALKEVDAAIAEGVEVGLFAEQLLGHYRDMLAAAVGCPAEMLLHSAPSDYDELLAAGKRIGLETLLASAQILDQTLTALRQSSHVRTLVEIAVVRLCKLEDLDQLSTLIAELREGSEGTSPRASNAPQAVAARAESSAPPAQKKTELAPAIPPLPAPQASNPVELRPDTAEVVWRQVLAEMGDMTSEMAQRYDRIAISAPNRLVVSFKQEYNLQKESCERPKSKERLEQAMSRLTGTNVRIDFELLPGESKQAEKPAAPISKRQMMREKERHPLVRQAIEMFDAELTDLESAPRQSTPTRSVNEDV